MKSPLVKSTIVTLGEKGREIDLERTGFDRDSRQKQADMNSDCVI